MFRRVFNEARSGATFFFVRRKVRNGKLQLIRGLGNQTGTSPLSGVKSWLRRVNGNRGSGGLSLSEINSQFIRGIGNQAGGGSSLSGKWKWIGLGCVFVGAQWFYGDEDDFYDHRFITNKDPDDLASFYGGEEFMQLFTVFPWVERLMMRGATFDDLGIVHAPGLPGEMIVSMDFEDGEDEKGVTAWFNKRECFSDQFLGHVVFETSSSFGFHRLADGSLEVYHHGEYFHGPWFVRLIFDLHARYVIWATEHHVNCHGFTAETPREEEIEEESRHNMIFHRANSISRSFIDRLEHNINRKIAKRKTLNRDTKDLEETLSRLEAISDEECTESVSRLQRRKTRLGDEALSVHFKFNDAKTEKTIRDAIEASTGK